MSQQESLQLQLKTTEEELQNVAKEREELSSELSLVSSREGIKKKCI